MQCIAGGVSLGSSMMTTYVVSVKSRHTASILVTVEGSARHALMLPIALVVPSSYPTITTGILLLIQTQLSVVQTPLHAGQAQLRHMHKQPTLFCVCCNDRTTLHLMTDSSPAVIPLSSWHSQASFHTGSKVCGIAACTLHVC